MRGVAERAAWRGREEVSMDRKLQVFVSSTYEDMKPERQAAVEAILTAGHIPAGMELFAAGEESQMATIRRWIDDSDVFMLIFGGRYGSIEPKSGLSYIETEYDYAITKGKPVFAVVINEAALEAKVREQGTAVMETEHQDQLKAFRQKALARICSRFEDCKDIKLAIHESLGEIQNRRQLDGWVKASEVPSTQGLLSEIDRLTNENAVLREEVSQLRSKVKAGNATNEETEFADIMTALHETMLTLPEVLRTRGEPEKESVLIALFAHQAAFITGICNNYGMLQQDQYLFFQVGPKLQVWGLAETEKVTGAKYRRYYLTKKGERFLAYMDQRIRTAEKAPKEAAEPSQSQAGPTKKRKKRKKRKKKEGKKGKKRTAR